MENSSIYKSTVHRGFFFKEYNYFRRLYTSLWTELQEEAIEDVNKGMH